MIHDGAILFRIDAGPEIGFGHLARTLVLAEALRDRGVAVRFCPSSAHDAVLDRIRQGGFDIAARDSGAAARVYDLIHSDWLSDKDGLFAEIAGVAESGTPVVLIDGYGERSYRCQAEAPTVDVVVAPYVGEPGRCEIRVGRVLAGPRYFPLACSYRDAPRRDVAADVERVLVTCGGADPFMGSPVILRALLQMPRNDLYFDVVIGAMFSEENKRRVETALAENSANVTLLQAPENLSAAMARADICVCANGLTKYELAAMGVPTVSLSLTAAHHRANLAFAETGALRVLGLLKETDAAAIGDAVSEMIDDPALRARMSGAGRELVDGRGTDRILEEAKLIPC